MCIQTQPSINKKRNKNKINKQILINDIIDYLDSRESYQGFSIKKKYITNNNFILTKLLYLNKETVYNYMDTKVREICSIIANDLRDILGKNLFFDLKNGDLIFYI